MRDMELQLPCLTAVRTTPLAPPPHGAVLPYATLGVRFIRFCVPVASPPQLFLEFSFLQIMQSNFQESLCAPPSHTFSPPLRTSALLCCILA
mmetsp:Transcript_12906/g.22326  ORF Transcript_12906/g.22326 Transcript_12906/m.22326 type:complete len:92 (-) Transcript_12906:421-696(-)